MTIKNKSMLFSLMAILILTTFGISNAFAFIGNPPVITLKGDNPQTIQQNTPYIELGATATDVEAGNLTASIIINSTAVNTSIVGSYLVNYTVTDNDTNTVSVLRTVNVIASPVAVAPGGFAHAVPSQSVPSLGGTGNHYFHDGLEIDGRVFDISKYNVEIPKQSYAVGNYITIHLKEMPLYGASYWQHAALYMNFGGKDNNVANAVIGLVDDRTKGSDVSDPQGYVKNVYISSTASDSGTMIHTFQFQVAKEMSDSQITIRVWDNRLHSVDVHVHGALQFGLDKAKPEAIVNPNDHLFGSLSAIDEALDYAGYEKPNLLSRISTNSQMFPDPSQGHIVWGYNDLSKTMWISFFDGQGNVLGYHEEQLVLRHVIPMSERSHSGEHLSVYSAEDYACAVHRVCNHADFLKLG